ncbi:9901_t:CDS:1, partial [Gigaspora rosea]
MPTLNDSQTNTSENIRDDIKFYRDNVSQRNIRDDIEFYRDKMNKKLIK